MPRRTGRAQRRRATRLIDKWQPLSRSSTAAHYTSLRDRRTPHGRYQISSRLRGSKRQAHRVGAHSRIPDRTANGTRLEVVVSRHVMPWMVSPMSPQHPVAHQLLAMVQECSGYAIELRNNPRLSGVSARSLHAAVSGCSHHLIEYLPRVAEDHAIAHECAHLLAQQQRIEQDTLYYPLIPQGAFTTAEAECSRHPPATWQGTGAETYTYLAELITQTVRQAQNYPQDIQIEQWLATQFPSFATCQEAALLEQITETTALFAPSARRRLPPPLYSAALAMNYALTRAYVDRLPYPQLRDTAAQVLQQYTAPHLGERLLAVVPTSSSTIYQAEVDTTTTWATLLGFEPWLQWHKVPRPTASFSART